jgi:Flagellar biosynthesis protein, FliO
MTRLNSAATAETQQSWASVLRITEVAAGLPSNESHRAGTSAVITLQMVFEKLQAGWRWVERKRSQQLSAKRLRVAETISLGEKRTLSIVMVDGSQYLIGSSAGGVQLLTKLDETTQGVAGNEGSR